MRILLVTPQASDRDHVVAALAEPGHDVAVAESAGQATAAVSSWKPDLLVLDLATAETLNFLRRHAALRGNTPVVCVADRRKPEAATEALRLGVADIVGRPVRADDVLAAMANASEVARHGRMPRMLPELPDRPQAVFGASPAMRDVLGIVRRVAQSRAEWARPRAT